MAHHSEIGARYLRLLLRTNALQFGTFMTKSGRESPYFIDSGRLDTGDAIAEAADCYAALLEGGDVPDVLFGPAYKGIPLAVATAEALTRRVGRPIGWLFNRKEAKDHGERGALVGRLPRTGETVTIIEDVLTGGTSVRETIPLLARHGITPTRLLVGVDREERGSTRSIARDEIRGTFGIEVRSILTLTDILETLDPARRAKIQAYIDNNS